jgi:hypothetical protein
MTGSHRLPSSEVPSMPVGSARVRSAGFLVTTQEVGPQLERRVGSRSAPRGRPQTIRLLAVLTVGRPVEVAATHSS